MPTDALRRALTEPGNPALRPLPEGVVGLLEELDAPPRLGAHLRAVHDVAWRLVDWVEGDSSGLVVDREAVFFGAATHDIGKVVHVGELSGPGSAHEEAGYELLVARGVAPGLARFARTHGSSWTLPDVAVEDLLVSLADKVWKGKRVPELEQVVVERLAAGGGEELWEVFMRVDDLLERVGSDADRRLAFQARFPIG